LILDAAGHGSVYPLLYVAKVYGYDVTRLSVRQSFARAARRLADEKHVALWTLRVPTTHNALTGYGTYRTITCVSRFGAGDDLTNDDVVFARRCSDRVHFGTLTDAGVGVLI
jgi:hypothetical protein